jgi:hypothetical protein
MEGSDYFGAMGAGERSSGGGRLRCWDGILLVWEGTP